MKTFTIALNTLSRSFRSMFALVFMFGIPLLVAGMFSLMFGGPSASPSSAPAVEKVRLEVANLDRGDPALSAGLPNGASLGSTLLQALGAEGTASLVEIIPAADEAAALQAVRSGQAEVALVIPADFSAAYASMDAQAALKLYSGPAASTQAAIVQAVLTQVSDIFSGVKIAMQVALSAGADAAEVGQTAQAYAAEAQRSAGELIEARTSTPAEPSNDPIRSVVGPILGGMMIFFAFFTGCSTAQSILREQEDGTLPRLFTTPTRLVSILGGKYAAVGLTVLVQVTVLLAAGRLLFSIPWGSLAAVSLAALGIIVSAASFGILATSLLKSNRQAGMVFGGLLSVTGMIGMLGVFTGSASVPLISLFTPQGWAIRGLLLAMNGAGLGEAVLNLGVLAALSVVFFGIGMLRFQKRFA